MRTKSLAAPYTVWMVIFTVVPLAMVAYFAFTTSSGEFTWPHGASFGIPAGAAALGMVRPGRLRHLPHHRLPRGLRHSPDLGQHAEGALPARHPADVHELPAAHPGLGGPPARHGHHKHPARGPRHRPPAAHPQRGQRHHGHGIHLPALHDNAAIHRHLQARTPGSSRPRRTSAATAPRSSAASCCPCPCPA